MERRTGEQNWQHEWRAEHVQLIFQNKRKLWFRLLEFCMLVHDFDPYAIFKCNVLNRRTSFINLSSNNKKIRECSRRQSQEQKIIDKRHDRSLYRSEELQLGHTRRDEFRRRFTRPLKVFAVYFVIKSLIISLAHHTLMRYEYLVPKNLSASRPLMSVESAQLIARNLGIPFYALKDISLTLFFTATCFCNICIVVLPMFQRRHPANIASLRFVLDPHLELRRVDASIRRKLTATKCSLQVYERQQIDQYRRVTQTLQSFTMGLGQNNQTMWLDELKRREHDYCRHINACLDWFDKNIESLRPSTFEPQYFASISGLLGHVVLNTHANYSFVWVVVTSSLVFTEYSAKCPGLDCDPWRVFSWPEILVAVEAQTIFAIACLSCCLNFSLLALLTASQLKIIKSIGLELLACQRAISSFIHLERWGRDTAPHEPINSEHISTQRDELEALLLKSITRLSICDRELKDNARGITEQTIHPACYMGSALFLAALNIQFKLPESNFLRSFVVGVIWLSVNMIAVSCANIHARVLSLQRNLWSILALGSHLRENNYYVRQFDLRAFAAQYMNGPLSYKIGSSDYIFSLRHARSLRYETRTTARLKGKCCTFVSDLWLKFVYSTSANIEQHCSRLLRMELSYQNIIEANFFSIFIYSLTLAYDR